jgi:hypothetical protein
VTGRDRLKWAVSHYGFEQGLRVKPVSSWAKRVSVLTVRYSTKTACFIDFGNVSPV